MAGKTISPPGDRDQPGRSPLDFIHERAVEAHTGKSRTVFRDRVKKGFLHKELYQVDLDDTHWYRRDYVESLANGKPYLGDDFRRSSPMILASREVHDCAEGESV